MSEILDKACLVLGFCFCVLFCFLPVSFFSVKDCIRK